MSKDAFWFWTVEYGGEDFTSLLAKSTKKTHVDAETVKRNIAELTSPAEQYAPVEKKLAEFQSRLKRLLSDAMSQHERFDVIETWCSGGGVLTHGFFRDVMLDQPSK